MLSARMGVGPVGRIAAVLPTRAAGLAGRVLVGTVGEAAQSGFHFLVNLLLLRALPPAEYGLFALLFALGSFWLTYMSAAVALPAALGLSRLRSPGARAFQEVVLGSVATAAAIGVAATATLGLWLWTGAPGTAAASGAFIGLWGLRHGVRATRLARREPARAAGSDLAFAGTGCLGLLALACIGASLPGAFLVLSVANAAGTAAGLLGPVGAGKRRPVRVSLRRSVRRRYRVIFGQVGWSLVGVTTVNVQANCQAVMVATAAGPAAFAPIAAALVLTAPLRLATAALIAVVQPDFARALTAGSPADVRHLLGRCALLVLLGCLLYGALLALAWPLLAAGLFGKFGDAPMVRVTAFCWAISAAYLSAMLPKAAVEAAGGFRAVARIATVGAVLAVAGSGALLLVADPATSLLGLLLSEVVTLLLLWREALGALRSRVPANRVTAVLAQAGKRRLR